MLEYVTSLLDGIERNDQITDSADVTAELRKLGLNDFANVLWSMPAPRFPKLSTKLPSMASAETQKSWTGSHGEDLLNLSVAFARSASANYAEITGQTLSGRRILDFGCGYGRFVRIFSYFTDQIIGVDPWSESVRICHEHGLEDRVFLSSYLPEELPVPRNFDFAFCFSVFTHLSERATKQCLRALHHHLEDGAVLCLTIRPIEYWGRHYTRVNESAVPSLEEHHRKTGFAFAPHHRDTVDGDVTYGDTSMTVEWLAEAAHGFEIKSIDRSNIDPLQQYVFLQKV